MSDSHRVLKAIEYALGASLISSFAVLFAGSCVFGFRFAEWLEWQGRLVGMVAVIGGVAGAIFGLRMALRARPGRAMQ